MPTTPRGCWTCRPGRQRRAPQAAGRGPVLGNAGREVLRAEQGRMERADAGGTAVYTVRLQAEYTQVYTEETT